jgi:hypothetical protein
MNIEASQPLTAPQLESMPAGAVVRSRALFFKRGANGWRAYYDQRCSRSAHCFGYHELDRNGELESARIAKLKIFPL